MQMSELNSLESALHWKDYYWKQLVFFICLTVTLKSVKQIRLIIFLIASIIFLYQIYSWMDFINGGSYVAQQGMKRMKGTWADTGYGAGNAWGLLGLFGIPFAIAIYGLVHKPVFRPIALCFGTSCVLCIFFSGTRGAMVASAVLGVVHIGNRLHDPRYIVATIAIIVFGFPFLPVQVQNRFLTLVQSVKEEEATQFDKIATESARGRLQGLVDGFRLANNSPVFGCGPAVSAQAVGLMREKGGQVIEEEKILQLHNLYGQVVGELGYVGFFAWISLVLTVTICVSSGRATAKLTGSAEGDERYIIGTMILGLMGVMLVYGMAGHTLYDYRWLIVFALANSYSALPDVDAFSSH